MGSIKLSAVVMVLVAMLSGVVGCNNDNNVNNDNVVVDAPFTINITTDGRSGEQFLNTLKEMGKIQKYDDAPALLLSEHFVPTNTTYELVVIRCSEVDYDHRTLSGIKAEAEKRGYSIPPVEVAPYLFLYLSEDALAEGPLMVMHEPITVVDEDNWSACQEQRFVVHNFGNHGGLSAWRTCSDTSNRGEGWGFVFLAPVDSWW